MSKPTGSGNARPRYITPEGDRALRDELQYLWKVKRPEVTQAVRGVEAPEAFRKTTESRRTLSFLWFSAPYTDAVEYIK